MSRPGKEPRPLRWEASTVANSYSNSVSIALRNIYMSPRHGSPQCMWLHEHTKAALGCRPNSTRKPVNPEYWHHLLSSKTDHVGVTTMERLDQGRLHPILDVPKLTCLGWDWTQPQGWVGGKYSSKSYSNSVLIAIRYIYCTCEPAILPIFCLCQCIYLYMSLKADYYML
jgi:hypothetical protein